MRQILQEKNYFVYRDADGVLGFTLRSYDGEPNNPGFLFDGEHQIFLLRRPGQIILLDMPADEFVHVLMTAKKVRILETPEDSSEILRQYDVPVTKINSIVLSEKQLIATDDAALNDLAVGA